VVSADQEHLMQLTRTRFPGCDPPSRFSHQHWAHRTVLARVFQHREELVSRQCREVDARLGRQSPQGPLRAFLLDISATAASRRGRNARPGASEIGGRGRPRGW